MNAKNVLVTGGAGFLGSHLCRTLLEQGKNVVCLDDLSSGTAEHAEELSVYPGFTFIRADVAEELPEICPDQIYHLACDQVVGITTSYTSYGYFGNTQTGTISETLPFWPQGSRTMTWQYGFISSSYVTTIQNFSVTAVSGSIFLLNR